MDQTLIYKFVIETLLIYLSQKPTFLRTTFSVLNLNSGGLNFSKAFFRFCTSLLNFSATAMLLRG